MAKGIGFLDSSGGDAGLRRARHGAFTLIELLVVVALIAILAAIALPCIYLATNALTALLGLTALATYVLARLAFSLRGRRPTRNNPV